jgi:hypothetical protein
MAMKSHVDFSRFIDVWEELHVCCFLAWFRLVLLKVEAMFCFQMSLNVYWATSHCQEESTLNVIKFTIIFLPEFHNEPWIYWILLLPVLESSFV